MKEKESIKTPFKTRTADTRTHFGTAYTSAK
jgi:hypothetical protein